MSDKPTLEMLDAEIHQDLKVNLSDFSDSCYKVNACYVMVGELPNLVHEYPIFIVKNQQSQQYQLNALFGFEAGENLYLQDDKWQARFQPLDILRRPFQIYMPEGEQSSEGRIALDRSANKFQGTYGESLFEKDGQPSPYLQRIQQVFSQLMNGSKAGAHVLARMAELNLIESVSLATELASGESVSVKGVYSVNETALKALSGEALEECHQKGILQICHLMLSSSAHLEKLISWKNQQVAS
ncbi:SapC family protein [Agaribacterium sp. ZY112]|uniref:SapC family protein n=1 Tax=Agaribacterium sp. ZY112 TaxID=3233574 RepID=UPI003523A03C